MNERILSYAAEKETLLRENDYIDPSLYSDYNVMRGLRDLNGNGVLAGLTNISKIISSKTVDGERKPCDGE